MHKRFSVRCCLLLLGLAWVGSSGFATTQQLRTGGDLVAAADAVVLGRCSSVQSEWHDRALVTRYTIAIDETLKGDVGSEVVLWVPGGVDRNREIPIAVTVPGAPALFAGEEILLFLSEFPEAGGYSLASFAQGKITIHRDPGGAAWLGLGSASERYSLEAVVEDIRSFVAHEAKQEGER